MKTLANDLENSVRGKNHRLNTEEKMVDNASDRRAVAECATRARRKML